MQQILETKMLHLQSFVWLCGKNCYLTMQTCIFWRHWQSNFRPLRYNSQMCRQQKTMVSKSGPHRWCVDKKGKICPMLECKGFSGAGKALDPQIFFYKLWHCKKCGFGGRGQRGGGGCGERKWTSSIWRRLRVIFHGSSIVSAFDYLGPVQTWCLCLGMGTSLNIAYCWFQSTNLGTVPRHRQ